MAVDHLQAPETVFLIRSSVAYSSFINNMFEGVEVCSRVATMAGVAKEEVAVQKVEVNLVVWYT
jgi:hypothetical protein